MTQSSEAMPEPTLALFRNLPQLGELLCSEPLQRLAQLHSRELVAEAAREALAEIRAQLKAGQHTEASLQAGRRGGRPKRRAG